MQDENIDLLCAVQQKLKALAQQQKSHYFNEVKTFWPCETSAMQNIQMSSERDNVQ